jgi:hypothetical protein
VQPTKLRLEPRSIGLPTNRVAHQSSLHSPEWNGPVPDRSLLPYGVVAGASDFPHSRQEDFERDVINPQNGHILCAAKPRTGGASEPNRFDTDTLNEAQRRRKWSFHRTKLGNIAIHLHVYSLQPYATGDDPSTLIISVHECSLAVVRWFFAYLQGRRFPA